MNGAAQLPASDRSDLFRVVADQKGVTVQIFEKDFWVCWVLLQLSLIDSLPAEIFFKGGTSLSKVFHVIERMSEDIDLVIDRKALGFVGDRDPMQDGLSGKARERLIEALKVEAANFVDGPLLSALQERFVKVLGDSGEWSLRADIDNPDNANIFFSYPTNEVSVRVSQNRCPLGTRCPWRYMANGRWNSASLRCRGVPRSVQAC